MNVMASASLHQSQFPVIAAGISRKPTPGKDILPDRITASSGVFVGERVRHPDPSGAKLHVFSMLYECAVDLAVQRVGQSLRQGDVPVFFSFAISDKHLLSLKVNVFDPQPNRLHKSQPRSVLQTRDETMDSERDGPEHLTDFRYAKYHGHMVRMFGSYDVEVEPLFQKVLIQHQQCGKGLLLRAGGGFPRDGEICQKLVHLL